jgi:hypothetical protein
MKTPVTALILGVVVLGAGAFVGSCGCSTRNGDLEYEQRKAEAGRIVRRLVARHNAVTEWLDTYREKGSIRGEPYTLDLEDALLKTGGRPLLFLATLEDVGSRGGSYYIRLEDWERDICLLLACTEEVAREIAKDEDGWFAEYAVIASISEVWRPRFSVRADPANKDAEAELDLAVGGVFVVEGTLVELTRLECLPDWPGD